MSELLAIAGASLLGAATVPQALRLVRTRSVGDFSWAFTCMNFLGLGLLAVRAWVIQEWAFLAINLVTAGFWGLTLAIKAMDATPAGKANEDAEHAGTSARHQAEARRVSSQAPGLALGKQAPGPGHQGQVQER